MIIFLNINSILASSKDDGSDDGEKEVIKDNSDISEVCEITGVTGATITIPNARNLNSHECTHVNDGSTGADTTGSTTTKTQIIPSTHNNSCRGTDKHPDGSSNLDAIRLLNNGLDFDEIGKYEKAIEYYDRALAIDPNYAIALNNKASALTSLGKYEEAIEYIDLALDIDPNYVNALSNKGLALSDLGKSLD